MHAVRNCGAPGAIVTSLTHNFVDATNLADVVADATRSISQELLPMARELKPKRTLKTLAKALRIPAEELVEALRELAAVLGRLSAARNKLLVTQLEKRDELLHEREHRQTLVEQLLLQVDRSRSLRRPKPGKR